MTSFLSEFGDGLLSLLFPPRCESCGTLQEPLICPACAEGISRITAPCCAQCGLPFDPLAHATTHCEECREEPPFFDVARAGARYGGPLRLVIHAFKYAGARALAAPLAALIAEGVTLPLPIDCLTPVPLHPARQAMRGYNQSRLLAEELGALWNLPVEELLQRTRNIPPQMQLPRDERRRNVRNAFAALDGIAGRCIGLVDDVYTTGSTLRECSRLLKGAGAAHVVVITVARAVGDAQ
jgi:ComF family protein